MKPEIAIEPVKRRGGRPKEAAALLADEYRVTKRVILRIGVERFLAMDESARRSQLNLACCRLESARGGRAVCLAEERADCSELAFEDALMRCGEYRGHSIAEWMEEFGRSKIERAELPPLEALQSSCESRDDVSRMVELAMKLRVA